MNITSDGAEIDSVQSMEVYGDWIKFIDQDGSVIKIPPFVVTKLKAFALAHATEFSDSAWDEE